MDSYRTTNDSTCIVILSPLDSGASDAETCAASGANPDRPISMTIRPDGSGFAIGMLPSGATSATVTVEGKKFAAFVIKNGFYYAPFTSSATYSAVDSTAGGASPDIASLYASAMATFG